MTTEMKELKDAILPTPHAARLYRINEASTVFAPLLWYAMLRAWILADTHADSSTNKSLPTALLVCGVAR